MQITVGTIVSSMVSNTVRGTVLVPFVEVPFLSQFLLWIVLPFVLP